MLSSCVGGWGDRRDDSDGDESSMEERLVESDEEFGRLYNSSNKFLTAASMS